MERGGKAPRRLPLRPRLRTKMTEAIRLADAVERAHTQWADAFLDRFFNALQERVDLIGYLESKGWTKGMSR